MSKTEIIERAIETLEEIINELEQFSDDDFVITLELVQQTIDELRVL